MKEADKITPEQLGQLLWFAGKRGRTWKSQLIKSWMYGYCPTPELQQLRNTHGVAWLRRFRVK